MSDEAERSMISKLKSHLAYQHGGEKSFFSYYTNINILSKNMMYVHKISVYIILVCKKYNCIYNNCGILF